MKIYRLWWLAGLFCSVSFATPRCGPYSCLKISPAPQGTLVRIEPINTGRYACYLRYENTWMINEDVTLAMGPVLLREGYPTRSLLFRCDPLPGCAAWMREHKLCGETQQY